MENENPQPIIEPSPAPTVPASTPVVHTVKHKGLIIGGILTVVVILGVVLTHKKVRSPEEDLAALESVSIPTTKTVEQRADQLSKLGSVPSDPNQ